MKYTTYDEVFSYENLYKAYKHCIKNVRWKTETQRFIMSDNARLRKIYNELHDGTYKSNKFKEFDIVERGKPRHISAHTIRDRIVQRCLCDNYLVPLLSNSLIYDCGATIKNKGITFSQKRVDTHLHKFYRHHGVNGYCLTIDIHHYFDSISHKELLRKMSFLIEDYRLYNLIKDLIGNFKGEMGLGLGSQISQICALYYISDLDHYIKEKLHIKYYGRYMDDMYLIHHDYQYLQECLYKLSAMFKEMGLELNKKTKIHRLSNGFVFTKIRYILTNSGKVLHFLTTKTFKAMKRKIKKGVDVKDVIPSWKAYCDKFNCHNRYIAFLKRHVYTPNYHH